MTQSVRKYVRNWMVQWVLPRKVTPIRTLSSFEPRDNAEAKRVFEARWLQAGIIGSK